MPIDPLACPSCGGPKQKRSMMCLKCYEQSHAKKEIVTDDVLRRENQQLKRQLKHLTEGEYDAERVIRRLEQAVYDVGPQFEPITFKPVRAKEDRTAQDLVL